MQVRKRLLIVAAAMVIAAIVAARLPGVTGPEPPVYENRPGKQFKDGPAIERDHNPGASPTDNSAEAAEMLQQSEDLVASMRRHAQTALNGNPEAQVFIARAMITCLSVSNFPAEKLAQATIASRHPTPTAFTERIVFEQQRCRRFGEDDPFEGLPPREGGYTAEYWLTMAAARGHPLALAIAGSNEVLSIIAEPPGPEKVGRLTEVQQALERAVRASDPEVNYYIARALMFADNKGEGPGSVRGAGWLLLACRQGICDRLPDPLALADCPTGLGRECSPVNAIQHQLEQGLGPEQYAQAVQLSYQLENSLRMQLWDELDLSLHP